MTGRPAGRLILMCGLPGSGKTTLARRLEHERGAVRLTPDEWLDVLGLDLFDEQLRDRLERRFWRLGQALVLAGVDVVLDFGFWIRAEREDKRLWCRRHGVGVELHVVEAPFEVLVERVTARDESRGSGQVPLTREDLASYRALFEPVEAAESAQFDVPPG